MFKLQCDCQISEDLCKWAKNLLMSVQAIKASPTSEPWMSWWVIPCKPCWTDLQRRQHFTLYKVWQLHRLFGAYVCNDTDTEFEFSRSTLYQVCRLPGHYSLGEVRLMSVLTICDTAGISTTTLPGLYNPITLTGSIIVDGVAASVHSDWFLDELADATGMTSYLPMAYQVVDQPRHLPIVLLLRLCMCCS